MDGMSEGNSAEDTGTHEPVEKSSLTEPPSCPNLAPNVTPAEPTPLHTTPVEPAPLRSVKHHNSTTVKVGKYSTNVEVDEKSANTAYPVYVKSLLEAEDVLHRFENETKHRFTVWRCPRDFGNSQIDVKNKRIFWQEFDIGDKITVKSDGVPFIMMGRKVYDCLYGKDRNTKVKEKMRLQREEVLKTENIKTRKIPASRKLDCPAQVVFCEIVYFPDFRVAINTKYYRAVAAKKIKESFAAGFVKMENIERRIYISFPTLDEHTKHPSAIQGTNLSTGVDTKICKKLSQLVSSGIRSVKEMKQQLEIYINQELYPGKAKPFHSNRRYFPGSSVIRKKMFQELILQRIMILDCAQLDELVARIQTENPDDKIYTRNIQGINEDLKQESFSLSVEELSNDVVRVRRKTSQQQFIFVHQTSFQRHLLKRYGNHVCFLDPVYRTVKYPLPLFFVMVKTNVDYQAVATFVVQDENMESTKEALEFIKVWNPEWKPKVFMVDNDKEEITLVQKCFPDCTVLLSNFHRNEYWEHWLSQSCNGVVAHKTAILVYLKRLAQANSEKEFEEALDLLKHSDFWKCKYGLLFRQWLEEKWLRCKKRWVFAYQKTLLCDLMLTNVTVERQQKKDFIHEELLNEEGTSKTSFVLKIIIALILPSKRDYYVEQNSRREQDASILSFYQMRPRHLAEHMAKCLTSVNEFTAADVVVNNVRKREFVVKSPQSDVKNKVYFGTDVELPQCDCQDWCSTMMPCKHFLVVMQHFKNWNWSCFPERYRNSPYFTLDPIADQNFGKEDRMEDQTDTRVSREDHSESQVDQNGTQRDSSGNERDERIERNQTASRVGHNQAVRVELSKQGESQVNLSVSSHDDKDSITAPAKYYKMLCDKKSEARSKAAECRDLLTELSNLTYLIQDKVVLSSLYDDLQKTLEHLKQSVVDDDVEKETSTCEENKVQQMKGTKRLGDWSEDSVGGKVVRLDEDKSNVMDVDRTAVKCISEVLECEGEGHQGGTKDGNAAGDTAIPGNLGDMNGCRGMSRDINGDVGIAESTNVISTVSGNTNNLQTSTQTANGPLQLNGSQSDESADLNFSELENKNVTVLRSSTPGRLSKYEERLVTKQEEIARSTVSLAQDTLKETFPQVKGFQTVIDGPIQSFEPVSGDFIQILHDGNGHWVCVSNTKLDVKDPAAVNMYDSMNQGFIAKFTKQQLASFLCIQSAEMKIIMKSVQQQTSHVDCGVFAIAFATALAFGRDPSKLRFDVPKMRPHLVECLKLKKMSPFPEVKHLVECLKLKKISPFLEKKPGHSDVVLSKRKFYTVELFCTCRMPYEKPKSEADLMAQCRVCCKWFHQRCDSLKTSGHDFVCKLCSRDTQV